MIGLITLILAFQKIPKFEYFLAQHLKDSYRKMEVVATGYCSCRKCCGWDKGITASGKKVRIGMVAMDKKIPFGTIIIIPGMEKWLNTAQFVVEDRGGAIKEGRIDIYFPTHSQALQFGRKKMTIYIKKKLERR